MDAGLAAVIAGASGAAGAALAAWATGRAMVRQVHVQAQQGFDQWLRERRQDAYAALLSAGDAVHDALDGVMDQTVEPGGPGARRAAWRAVNGALRTFDRAGRTADIVSPPDVGSQRILMREALQDVVAVWRAPSDPPLDERLIAHAAADRAWRETSARYLALIQKDMQSFDA
ncbi:hypothetical protein [Streptomyces longhuiensis]|uniref:hypothetical protein n=1 Tax=Streptomyces longhuiensis TaxID=2880933 RepID=UPI001D09A3A2|nr:hypothetical protein [Streptomyces longhuiensis]UDM03301.1 hypothetical protein LGI35_36100 [Streptomyces longhuiensis]